MLASKVLLNRQVSRLKCGIAYPRYATRTAEEPRAEVVQVNLETKLSPLTGKLPKREPFAKNLFIGKFDEEFLTYPEAQTLERQQQYTEWLDPVENFVKNTVDDKEIDAKATLPKEVTDGLQELGVFGAMVSEPYRGIGLNCTEYARLLEAIGTNFSLGACLANHARTPLDIILRFASEQQKNEYLPRIASGELIGAICMTEASSGSNVSSIKAEANITECGKFWNLNGKKILVANGSNANLFIVFAQCSESGDIFNTTDKLAVLLVERKHGGISCGEPVEKLGQRGLETCTVTFKDTVVPKENVIGEIGGAPNILMHLLGAGRENVGARATVILREFMKSLSDHCVRRKHFQKQLIEFHSTQEIIAKMTCDLYAMESMTYLTTGMIDRFEDQDCTLESAMVEAYATKHCVDHIYNGMQLIGAQSYLKENPYERFFRDSLALTLFDGSNVDMNTYISLIGLQHAGRHFQEYVKQQRNPLQYPGLILRQLFLRTKKLNLGLEGNLHPTLRNAAITLEDCVAKLQFVSKVILSRHGNRVADHQMELRRIAEMAIDIYAMTAVLGRSSRAYCIGLRNAEDEILIAHTFCMDARHRVERNRREIEDGPLVTCDDNYQKISKATFKNGGYSPVHPLTKNF